MKAIALVPVAVLSTMFAGCVVAPAPGPGPYAHRSPPGVVYVAPSYESPGPGYAWEYHARYGWGWRHPQRGWHRGWE